MNRDMGAKSPVADAEAGRNTSAVDRLLATIHQEVDRFREACLAKLHDNYAHALQSREPGDHEALQERYEVLEEFVTHACNNIKQEMVEHCRDTLEMAVRATLTWSRQGVEAQQGRESIPAVTPQQRPSWREAWKQRHEIVTSYDVQQRRGRQPQRTPQREKAHAQGYGR